MPLVARCGKKPLMKSIIITAALMLAAAHAHAADLALNVGALEVVGLPGPKHLGLYPSVGLSAALEGPGITLIPALAIEWAPDEGRAGLVATLTADFAVRDWLGLDLGVVAVQDQPGARVSESAFYAGAGPGCSLLLGQWTISAYVNVLLALASGSVSLAPGLNVARTL